MTCASLQKKESKSEHHFHYAFEVCYLQTLARMVDSLVRVSRRDEEEDFVSILVFLQNVPHSLLCHVVGLVTVNVMNKSTQLTTLYHQKKVRVIRVMLTVPCRLFNKKKTRRTHSAPSLPFQQVQVLFHSLFKVLFIFPSRYLFAIGLPRLFSFRWTLPPASSCNPKQLDSLHYKNTPAHLQTKATAASNTYTHPQGWHLLWLFVRRRNWFADWLLLGLCLDGRQTTTPLLPKDFHPELIPLHSPLLRESLLVSFPPLSYMLKSSGSSCLIRGLKRRERLF